MYALDFKNGFQMYENSLSNAIIGEIHDELYIVDDTALNNKKVKSSIFAFYRDLVECGKPQFLFCLQLENTTEAELQKLITKKRNRKESTIADGDTVCFFSVEQLRNAEFYIDKIIIAGKEYHMMPSSIVSVVLLLKYLDKP